MAAKPHYTLTTHWTLNDGATSTSRVTGTLHELIEKLEKIAKPRNLPLFSEGAGPQVETLSRSVPAGKTTQGARLVVGPTDQLTENPPTT